MTPSCTCPSSCRSATWTRRRERALAEAPRTSHERHDAGSATSSVRSLLLISDLLDWPEGAPDLSPGNMPTTELPHGNCRGGTSQACVLPFEEEVAGPAMIVDDRSAQDGAALQLEVEIMKRTAWRPVSFASRAGSGRGSLPPRNTAEFPRHHRRRLLVQRAAALRREERPDTQHRPPGRWRPLLPPRLREHVDCVPCRAELYTGLLPLRSGVAWNHSSAKTGTTSIVGHLGRLGYRTGIAARCTPRRERSFLRDGGRVRAELRGRDGRARRVGHPRLHDRDRSRPFCLIVGLVVPHARGRWRSLGVRQEEDRAAAHFPTRRRRASPWRSTWPRSFTWTRRSATS